MRDRLLAESPEDIYGPLVICLNDACEAEFYTGFSAICPECGYDPDDDYEPPEPEYGEYPVGYDGSPGLGW